MGGLRPGAAQLQQAARFDPLSVIVQVNLGNALEAQGRFQETASRYRKAFEIDPLMPVPYRSLAMLAAYAMDDFVTAVPLAEKAVALDPDNPGDAMLLALLYQALGDDASFGRVLRRAEESWPDNVLVNMSLALRGRKKEALTALRAAERAGWRGAL